MFYFTVRCGCRIKMFTVRTIGFMMKSSKKKSGNYVFCKSFHLILKRYEKEVG